MDDFNGSDTAYTEYDFTTENDPYGADELVAMVLACVGIVSQSDCYCCLFLSGKTTEKNPDNLYNKPGKKFLVVFPLYIYQMYIP